MKRCILFLGLFLAALAGAGALGVDVPELKSAHAVEFINYTGPFSIFQTDFDIRGIGRVLSGQIEKGTLTARYFLKYSAIHAVDTAEPGKFSADLIFLDKEAKVDHIDNVRRIVSSYLERLYSYPRKDCDLLAVFVSYYNAVNRGNLDYFNGKYKTVVLRYLDAARLGISTKYYEWPGTTELVIPLNEATEAEALSPLSSTELTSPAVTEELRKREDKGIEERKAIVDLKQKEVEQGQQKVAEEAKKLAEQKAKTAAEESSLQKEKAAVEQKKAEAEKQAAAAQPAAGVPKPEQPPAAQEQAKAAEEKLAQAKKAEEAVKAKEADLAAKKEAQTKEGEKIAAKEKVLETKKEEIAAEKKQIASDETAVKIGKEPEKVKKELEQKSAELAQKEAEVAKREELARKGQTDSSIFKGRLYYLKIKEYLTGGHYNNDMLVINASTGKVIHKSTEANICGRKYDMFSDGVVVIGFNGDHREGHYLTLLDLDTLERKTVGTVPVFWRSFVEVREDFTYVVVNEAKAYYLGKFDADMKLAARSKDAVDPDTFVSFFGDLIYINAADKKILVLKAADLSTSGVIEP